MSIPVCLPYGVSADKNQATPEEVACPFDYINFDLAVFQGKLYDRQPKVGQPNESGH